MHQSIWQADCKLPEYPQFDGNIKTDVLVIGGGLCGLLCAYHLQKAGVDYILADGSKLFSGISKNSTGKITAQHGLIYSKLIRLYGNEIAKLYLDVNLNAVKIYSELCSGRECDFEFKNAYTYSTTNASKIENEVDAVNKLGFDAKFKQTTDLPFDTAGSICFENQAQFNVYKFAKSISSGLNIFEDSFVHELTPAAAYIGNSMIKADKFIVATHFPFVNMHGAYFLKLYQHRSYVSAYKNAPQMNGMYVDENKNGMSFRTYKEYLLIGGGGHRTAKGSSAWDGIEQFAKSYYPDATAEYQWAAQDCMSLDGIPYIGKYSQNTPNIYVASGFNKWGITSSMVAAQILTDMVMDRRNKYEHVFSPQRKMYLPQLAANVMESTIGLLTPTPKRCPHMGCALKWNKSEHSWDCPCHGSRFNSRGKLIDNPAITDADVE